MSEEQKNDVRDLLLSLNKQIIATDEFKRNKKNYIKLIIILILLIILMFSLAVINESFFSLSFFIFGYAMFLMLKVLFDYGGNKQISFKTYIKFKEDLLKILFPSFSFDFYYKKYSKSITGNDNIIDKFIYQNCDSVERYEVIYNEKFSLYYIVANIKKYGSFSGLVLLDKTDCKDLNIAHYDWFNLPDLNNIYFNSGSNLFLSFYNRNLFNDLYQVKDNDKLLNEINLNYKNLSNILSKIN